MKPTTNYILARPEAIEEKTAGGLFIPKTSQERPRIATVELVGKNITEVKKGDRVLYSAYGVTELTHDGSSFLLFKEDAVLAKVLR